MRPEILFPLFTPVTALPGIGPRLAKLVEKVAGPRITDLLWLLPTGIVDRRHAPRLAEAVPGGIVTVTVTVEEHRKPHSKRQPYRVVCSDCTGTLHLVYFHAREDWLGKTLPQGAVRVVSGRLERFW